MTLQDPGQASDEAVQGADPEPLPDREAFLEDVVASTLEPVIGGLAVLFLAIAVVQRFAMEPPFPDVMAPYSVAVGLLLGALYAWVRARGIPPRWAHAAGTGLVLLVLTGSVVPFALVQDPLQTTDLVLLAMGAGAVFVSRRWYLLNLALLVALFGAFVAANPGYARWPNLGVAVMSGAVVGYVVLCHRANLLESLHGLRVQEAQHNRQLEDRMDRIHELRQQAERGRDRVRRYAGQLESTNEDLHRFARTLSRHLQGPVQRARRTLADAGDDGAPAEARRELEDLEATLEALQEYAGLATHERDLEPLDLGEAVADAWRQAAGRHGADPGDLEAGDLPEVVADPELLERLLGELFENALLHGEPPVTVTAHRDGGAVRVAVEDRGPGVDPDHRDRIFHLLESGTGDRPGMGLAMSRRAAERLGGDVALDPDAAGGARFLVTLRGVYRIQSTGDGRAEGHDDHGRGAPVRDVDNRAEA